MNVVSSQWSVVSKVIFSFELSTLLLALTFSVQAQQPKNIPRVGFLGFETGNPVRFDAFRQGLRELGYVDGKNVVIERRSGNRLGELAAELVRLKVDVIVTGGSTGTQAARDATSTIPIVMAQDNDPIGSGFVASLARPGGNITGLSALSAEMNGKRLEILKEIVPKLSTLAVFGDSTIPGNKQALRDTELAAAALGVRLRYQNIQSPEEVEKVFRTNSKSVDAVLLLNNPVLLRQRTQIADLAAKSRLPAIYDASDFVEAGGLMSYGRDARELFKRSAVYVDKILKGAKPADLPVEQPTKFEFVVNLKAAKQIGLTIPPEGLARADRIIR
jgi:putative ABC transport system substrate-binding protein